jgi:hypothetical protein
MRASHLATSPPHLRFSSEGFLEHLSLPGGENVLPEAHGPAVDARLGRDRWLAQTSPAELVRQETMDDVVRLVLGLGPLLVHDIYRWQGRRIERTVRVENRSSAEVQLSGVRLWLCGAGLGDVHACRFEAPATALRPRLPLAAAAGRLIRQPAGREVAPAARDLWGYTLGDAPDVSPGLMAIHNPQEGLSLLVWYHSETEAASPRVGGNDKTVTLGHELVLASWLGPGESVEGGTQFIELHRGPWSSALSSFRKHYRRVGIVPPLYDPAPAWVRQAAVYEAHPGPFGGFLGLKTQLERIRSMGFNVLYLLPVMSYDNRSGRAWDENWVASGSPYAMRDFEAFEPTLGTEEDFLELVRAAHRLGMKVLMDFVAQGCALQGRYVAEHPEWFCRDEEGRMVSSHGWLDTYSFDWARPDFQDYMLGWALRFVRDYGIDGYRVDAPHGKEPNWDRSLPYHASATNLGVLRLLERLQREVKAINPQAALLCELFGPVFVRSHDFQYDYFPFAQAHALLRGELTAEEFGEWLDDYWAAMPPGAVRVSFTETHDTRAGSQAYTWRGSAGERAIFACLVAAGFVPMVWAGQESGVEAFFRGLLHARSVSSAVLFGERSFNAVTSDPPPVVSVVCREGGEKVWFVVSLHAERAPLHLAWRQDELPDRPASFRLVDLLTGQPWNEYGRQEWQTTDLQNVTLSLVPFVPYFFRLEPSGSGQKTECSP